MNWIRSKFDELKYFLQRNFSERAFGKKTLGFLWRSTLGKTIEINISDQNIQIKSVKICSWSFNSTRWSKWKLSFEWNTNCLGDFDLRDLLMCAMFCIFSHRHKRAHVSNASFKSDFQCFFSASWMLTWFVWKKTQTNTHRLKDLNSIAQYVAVLVIGFCRNVLPNKKVDSFSIDVPTLPLFGENLNIFPHRPHCHASLLHTAHTSPPSIHLQRKKNRIDPY